jgi:hypothetical protein
LTVALAAGCQQTAPPAGPGGPGAATAGRAAGGGDPPSWLTPVSFQEDRLAPIELKTGDGVRLRLRSLRGRSVVEGPIGFTELHLGFENPEDRTLEGRFRMVLPSSASISRFAMKIRGDWQEGEVVEKQRARRTFEDFLHRRQDPALLEQGLGNEFTARVFPILPREKKEIVVSFSQEVGPRGGALVPLRGLEALDVDLVARWGSGASPGGASGAAGAPEHTLVRAGYVPDGDFVLPPRADRAVALRAGDRVAVRLSVPGAAEAAPVGSLLVLVDTSASRALGLAATVRELGKLSGELARRRDAKLPLTVACFDQDGGAAVFRGEAGALDAASLARIVDRGALGASDLGRALGWAREELARHARTRVLLVTDGVATAGATAPDELAAAVRALAAEGVERLDALAVGGLRDEVLLRRLTTSTPQAGLVLDGAASVDEIARRLSTRALTDQPLEVHGARWHWPRTLQGVQGGDDVFVYAELDAAAALRVRMGAHELKIEGQEATRPLVERAWAKAKIASLLEDGGKDPAALRDRVVELSTRHRVLSPFTALLVLETDADYRRYGMDRAALADILAIEDGRVVARSRRAALPPKLGAPPPPPPPPEVAAPSSRRSRIRLQSVGARAAPAEPLSARGQLWGDAVGESFGAGGLGLSGVGQGGGGRGEGVGLGGVGTIGHGAGRGREDHVEPATDAQEFGIIGIIGLLPSPAASAGPSMPRARGEGGEGSRAQSLVSADAQRREGFGSGHGRLGSPYRAASPSVRMGATAVSGRVPPEIIQRIVRQRFGTLRICYESGLARRPDLAGRVAVRFVIGDSGRVTDATVTGIDDAEVRRCIASTFRALSFPRPEGGVVTVNYPIVFEPRAQTPGSAPAPDEGELAPDVVASEPTPYEGRFATVMGALEAGRIDEARREVAAWRASEPAETLAWVALGRVAHASGEPVLAARAFGSIIDLFPARADLRRFAAAWLVELDAGRALALDSYAQAEKDRPDHPTSHHLLAMALLRAGAHPKAFDVALTGLEATRTRGNAANRATVLREDLGLIGAAWIKASPKERDAVVARLAAAGIPLETRPSLRFVLTWETDANDVDLHVYDAHGDHAFYQSKALPHGGELLADVTDGYGPELFVVRGAPRTRAAWYWLKVNYYSRGPMGYGMGKVQIVDHDGAGGLRFDERPFVVMRDQAYVDLGKVAAR